jgi:hypothetical protein
LTSHQTPRRARYSSEASESSRDEPPRGTPSADR